MLSWSPADLPACVYYYNHAFTFFKDKKQWLYSIYLKWPHRAIKINSLTKFQSYSQIYCWMNVLEESSYFVITYNVARCKNTAVLLLKLNRATLLNKVQFLFQNSCYFSKISSTFTTVHWNKRVLLLPLKKLNRATCTHSCYFWQRCTKPIHFHLSDCV